MQVIQNFVNLIMKEEQHSMKNFRNPVIPLLAGNTDLFSLNDGIDLLNQSISNIFNPKFHLLFISGKKKSYSILKPT